MKHHVENLSVQTAAGVRELVKEYFETGSGGKQHVVQTILLEGDHAFLRYGAFNERTAGENAEKKVVSILVDFSGLSEDERLKLMLEGLKINSRFRAAIKPKVEADEREFKIAVDDELLAPAARVVSDETKGKAAASRVLADAKSGKLSQEQIAELLAALQAQM